MASRKAPKIKQFCPQGKSFSLKMSFVDSFGNIIDLTGFTARLEVRTKLPDENSTPGDDDVLHSVSTDDDIVIDGALGQVVVSISESVTAGFPVGAYFWELELVGSSGEVPYFMQPSSFIVLAENTL